MIETRVRILSTNEGTALVEPVEPSGCGACHARSACGLGGLGRYLRTGRRPVPVACDAGVRAGDELVVAVSEADLLKAGLLAYVLPIVLAVLGAVVASALGRGDAGAALGMASGGAVGLLAARRLGRVVTPPSARPPLTETAGPDRLLPPAVTPPKDPNLQGETP